ncbi:MAG: hypothetical protein JW993_13485 [Sedimentisphaerales bacterium]|nr:hypothetical protein [Sedimentisphaerales bacterium]
MKNRAAAFLLLFILALPGHSCHAARIYGTFHPVPLELHPKPWPRDVIVQVTGRYFQYDDVRESVHAIQFRSRDDFAKLWPSVLSVKTEGAPLILRRGPSSCREQLLISSGVYILYPMRGPARNTRPGIDPNLLDTVLGSPGPTPEYIQVKDNRWESYQDAGTRLTGTVDHPEGIYRVRTDIILVVDGNIVDLNRIPLPKDTPIIDERFPAPLPAEH